MIRTASTVVPTVAGLVRAQRPDDVVTMKYRADRRNVIADEGDLATEPPCG